jgi:predicted aspartyl protease
MTTSGLRARRLAEPHGTFWAVILTIAVLFSPMGPEAAPIYRWTDDQGNSHYSQGLDSVPERFRDRASRLPYQSAPPPAAVPSPDDDGEETVIRFQPGKPIYVTVRINGTGEARLILDTGADRTVIAPRALSAAGVSTRRAAASGRIRGATGTANIEAYPVESLEVGRARVGKMLVVSHGIETADTDGLLGRDFLDQFKVTIDNATGRLILGQK